jgi:hypothetical protein
MIEIPLTKGQIALIDDADQDLVCSYKWYAHSHKNHFSFYAATRPIRQGPILFMHCLLGGKGWDHVNGNGLDNRRFNLRPATVSQNNSNRPAARGSSSKYLGVSVDRTRCQWRAQISVDTHGISLGRFDTEQSAALAYDQAARQYHGEFAWLNSDHFEELQNKEYQGAFSYPQRPL